MDKFQNTYRGQTFRLKYWDYSQSGLYFITICTQNKEYFFGKIHNGFMELSEIGKVVDEEWLKTPQIRSDMNISLGKYVIMPNHFHAIIHIGKNKFNSSKNSVGICRDVMHCVPTNTNIGETSIHHKNKFGPQSKNLSSIVRGFKSSVTTWSRKNNYPNFSWQALFHDHIIRDKESLFKIQNYIMNNPTNWKDDEFY